MKKNLKLCFTALAFILSFCAFSQNLSIKDINKLRVADNEEVNEILLKKGWKFVDTMKKGKMLVYGFFTSSDEKPDSMLVIGKEKKLVENAIKYYTFKIENYQAIIEDLDSRKTKAINTITKGNKTVDFYENKENIYGLKRANSPKVTKFSIEICSKIDYENMLKQL